LDIIIYNWETIVPCFSSIGIAVFSEKAAHEILLEGNDVEINFFSDLVESMEKVVAGISKLTTLTQNEKDLYLKAFRETYFMLNANLNMIILYLGDSRRLDDDNFKEWASSIDNWNKWIQIEKDFCLCSGLQDAYIKTQKLSQRNLGPFIIQNWNAMLQQMQSTFIAEDRVAAYISKQFSEFAKKSRSQPIDVTRKEVEDFRDAIMKERSRLIKDETKLIDVI
jgi:hypothetical protein